MPLITCRDIGNIGRLGNQLFLYAHARGYAEYFGYDFQCGDWIGRKIFEGVDDPPVSVQLPQTVMDSYKPDMLGYYFGAKDIDIKQYAQHQKHVDFYTRAQVKKWFKLKPEYATNIVHNSQPYSAAHLRHGDYTVPPFNKLYAAIERHSYEKAVRKFNIPIPHYVYEGWNPDWNNRGDFPNAPPFLPDFLFLRSASWLLRANSSFSWWAGTLGNGKIYSPIVGDRVGWQDVEFVEGNHPATAGIFKNQSDLYLKEE